MDPDVDVDRRYGDVSGEGGGEGMMEGRRGLYLDANYYSN